MRVKFEQWDCIAKGAFYANDNKAIMLIDAEDGDPVATSTVNIVEEKIDEDIVFVKNYSENEGMTHALIEADIIWPDIIHTHRTEFVVVHAYRLTDKALNSLW